MMSQMNMFGFSSLILFSQTLLSVANASPARPDLAVSFQAAAPVKVYTAAAYSVRVSNIGNKDAPGSVLRIQLPQTANSPTKKIMGTLSNLNSGCTLSATLITCSLGTIPKNGIRNISFNFAFPHAEKALILSADVSSTAAESSSSNNSALLSPILTYDSIVVGASTINNRHCTGSQSLSSFLECIYATGSISQHTVEFDANGGIVTEDPGVTGMWRQLSSNQLYFEYHEGGQVIAYFQGMAINQNCFEGVTRFPLSPNYVSPYQVCLQP